MGADLIKWVQKIKWDHEDLQNSIRFRTDYFRNSLAIELIISEIASLGMSLTFVICPGWLSPLAPLLAPIFLLAYHVWNETDLLEIESTQPELSPVTQNVVFECSCHFSTKWRIGEINLKSFEIIDNPTDKSAYR